MIYRMTGNLEPCNSCWVTRRSKAQCGISASIRRCARDRRAGRDLRPDKRLLTQSSYLIARLHPLQRPNVGHERSHYPRPRDAIPRHSACLRGQVICAQNCGPRSTRLTAQDDRLAARSRSTCSVTSRAIATAPSTSFSVSPLTIAKVISTYSLRPLLCKARVSVGRP